MTNPATARRSPRCRSRGRRTSTGRCRRRAKRFPGWRATPPLERARACFRLKYVLEEQKDDLAALLTRDNGKAIKDAARRDPPRHRVRRGRDRDPVAHAGRESGGRLAGDRLGHDPAADRSLRRHHAVQLPLHGAHVVPPVRDRAAGTRSSCKPSEQDPLVDGADLRAPRPDRASARRRQPRERRQGLGERDPRAPGNRRRLVRGLHAGRALHLRDRRQARASASRRSAAPRTT